MGSHPPNSWCLAKASRDAMDGHGPMEAVRESLTVAIYNESQMSHDQSMAWSSKTQYHWIG